MKRDDERVQAVDDLRWYFSGEAQSELGARGQNYDGGLGGPPSENAADHRIAASMRFGRIEARLRRLAPEHVTTLHQAYSPVPPSLGAGRGRFSWWYELGPIAAALVEPTAPPMGVRRIVAMETHIDPKVSAGAVALRAIAQAALNAALAAYLGRPWSPPRDLPDFPAVPRLKLPAEPPRTWVPGEVTPIGTCRTTAPAEGTLLVGRVLRDLTRVGSPMPRPRRDVVCEGVRLEGPRCEGAPEDAAA